MLLDVEQGSSPAAQDTQRPLLRNPWFWGAVGAVVIAGVAGTASAFVACVTATGVAGGLAGVATWLVEGAGGGGLLAE